MSDGKVRAAIEEVEAWMADPSWEPDPDELARWTAEFQAALVQAEKGQGWPELAARAHAMGQELDARVARLAQVQQAIKAELDAKEMGSRALKGYGSNVR